MNIRINHSDDISVIGPILRVLRNTLDAELFGSRLALALEGGYRAFVTEDASGCLGYRITQDIFWGKTFYIDDLVVQPNLRSSGVGAALLERAKLEARTLKCNHIRLCSGLSRADAHRFYEQNEFTRTSIQFFHSLQD